MQEKTNTESKFFYYLKIAIKGFCMGTADVIPGVSGGTVAFLLGIYEELIRAIKSFDLQFLKNLSQLKFKEALETVHWKFLAALGFGIVCAILSFAKVLSWLLLNKPILINAFFFGLILATVPILGRIIKEWTLTKIISLVVSAVATFFLVMMVPISTPESYWFLFLSGALAISAMILPGISGAFILVLLGKYHFILDAINQRDLISIAIVGCGVVAGIVTFVRVLSWLFSKYHDITVAILTGLVLGSLNKIWPWKETIRSMTSRSGKVIPLEQINFIPQELTAEVLGAIVLMIVGFTIAIALNFSSGKKSLQV